MHSADDRYLMKGSSDDIVLRQIARCKGVKPTPVRADNNCRRLIPGDVSEWIVSVAGRPASTEIISIDVLSLPEIYNNYSI